jgi:hypothetical protein
MDDELARMDEDRACMLDDRGRMDDELARMDADRACMLDDRVGRRCASASSDKPPSPRPPTPPRSASPSESDAIRPRWRGMGR